MANEPYDPYLGKNDAAGTSNPKTAAIQQQIDDTVLPESRHFPTQHGHGTRCVFAFFVEIGC